MPGIMKKVSATKLSAPTKMVKKSNAKSCSGPKVSKAMKGAPLSPKKIGSAPKDQS